MPKSGGDITRKRILQVAEELFSEKGFDGTGIEEIAQKAGINKATIYYHFKSKNHIIEALFKDIIVDLNNHLKSSHDSGSNGVTEDDIAIKIGREIHFIEDKKKIISVMAMEALKNSDCSSFLFKCAEMTINNELKMHKDNFKSKKDLFEKNRQEFFVHEFFTGFIPFIMFVVLKEKFCDYFDYNKDAVFLQFLESFKKSHFQSHE
ncbi:MAG: hypothetical protein A2W19_14005 [Spirochaetes bacterium RBG_16_49_21]|nr:MAG: hypothetical protein A2W19_14005 [Spirochaetes bacterium RBG_16_49_21]